MYSWRKSHKKIFQSEIKHYNRILQVMQHVLPNQKAYFRIVVILYFDILLWDWLQPKYCMAHTKDPASTSSWTDFPSKNFCRFSDLLPKIFIVFCDTLTKCLPSAERYTLAGRKRRTTSDVPGVVSDGVVDGFGVEGAESSVMISGLITLLTLSLAITSCTPEK